MRSHSCWLSGFLALTAATPLACGSPADRAFDSTEDDSGTSASSDSASSSEPDVGVPNDAATADVASDRGSEAEPDASGKADTASEADAKSSADAGASADAATQADTGSVADASTAKDASTEAATGGPGPGPLATGDARSVSQPSYPAVCATLSAQFKTSQRGSPPSGDDTSRIQAALNTCKGTGHSVVLAASGSDDAFFSGTLTVNGEALVVNSGVTLFGSDGYSTELLDVEGANSAVMGPGIIDGRGDLISGTPRLIQASKITNFIVYNVTIENAGQEHLYVEGGNGFTAWNLTIATPADTANTDGIDIDSLTNATVYGSSIEDGDDGIAIKTNSAAVSNITIENSSFHGTHGMSIGSQTFDGVVNVLWKDNTVYGTDQWGNVSTDANGINIKSDVDCGGTVRQVTYLDTCMTGVKHLLIFNTSYGACSGTTGTPLYTDIVVDGVYATGSPSGSYSEFDGFSTSSPLGLTLENVHLDVTTQQGSQDAKVGLYDSNITPSGTGVTTTSVSGSGTVPTCTF
jgi:polygalacturonase